MLGIAGTRMLSESELIPVMAISKASKRHRAGRASLLVVSFIVGSSNGRPSGFSFARAGGGVAAGRGGGGGRGEPRARLVVDERRQCLRDACIIGVEPVHLVRREHI